MHFESVYHVGASASSDSLSQWRNYSGRLGYCVGIETGVQLAVVDRGGTSRTNENYERISGVIGGWYGVVYDSERQQQIIRDFIAASLESMDETYSAELMVSRDSGFLATSASTMKHQTFVDSPQEPLLLTQVTCGPANESEQRLITGAVARLLKDRGYDIPVTISTSPYRF